MCLCTMGWDVWLVCVSSIHKEDPGVFGMGLILELLAHGIRYFETGFLERVRVREHSGTTSGHFWKKTGRERRIMKEHYTQKRLHNLIH